MALNKFIPSSPDKNLKKDEDTSLAKFGHLNAIIDYINENNLAEVSITGPVVTETITSNATLAVKINGVSYKILLRS
jgi:hypothetical protein